MTDTTQKQTPGPSLRQ